MEGRSGRDLGPPGGLISFGLVGLVIEVGGRWLGGHWGSALTQLGAGAVSGGALVFFSRLAVWWSGRKQR
ncbi:MAG: hypothetical protein U0232_33505 [Thermomicrobiales bacterium]